MKYFILTDKQTINSSQGKSEEKKPHIFSFYNTSLQLFVLHTVRYITLWNTKIYCSQTELKSSAVAKTGNEFKMFFFCCVKIQF